MNPNEIRYAGIIADGPTDGELIFKLIKCLLGKSSCEKVTLGGSLRDGMDNFMRKASRSGNYSLFDDHANDLKNLIITLLDSAVGIFQTQVPRELSYLDLLILHTDSERHLNSAEQYFEEWAMVISKIFFAAIEIFYNKKVRQGFDLIYLPLVVPLILFPSTEILIAAAKTGLTSKFNFHGMKAGHLKMKLYGTDDLSCLDEEMFQKKASDIITAESCKAIYKHVPESRLFLHTLLWNQTDITINPLILNK